MTRGRNRFAAHSNSETPSKDMYGTKISLAHTQENTP